MGVGEEDGVRGEWWDYLKGGGYGAGSCWWTVVVEW